MQITVEASDIRGFVYSQTALLARAGKGEVECTPDNEDALEGLMDNVLANTSKVLRAGLWPTYEFSLDEDDREDVVLDVLEIEVGVERNMRAKMQLLYAIAYGLLAEWLKPFGNESFSAYSVQQQAFTNELVATLVSKPAEAAREIAARGDTSRSDGENDDDGVGMKLALEDNVVADMRKVSREWLEDNGCLLEFQ